MKVYNSIKEREKEMMLKLEKHVKETLSKAQLSKSLHEGVLQELLKSNNPDRVLGGFIFQLLIKCLKDRTVISLHSLNAAIQSRFSIDSFDERQVKNCLALS
jgi:hypothetical protein